MKITKKDWVYLAIIIILVGAILFLALNFGGHYRSVKTHESYFNQESPMIEPWMTPYLVSMKFNISKDALFKELKTNSTWQTERYTISRLCKERNLNCTEVINKLNDLKK